MSTIAAVATAPGKGAIGIVRISGPSARSLLEQLVSLRLQATAVFRPWVLHRGRFLSEDGSFLDDVLAVYMPAPKTYTGEDMAEIHCHGSPFILQTVLKRLYQLGALPAQPGEFTKRAFLHGRMDLSQAEAVAELVNSSSEEALKNSVERLDGALHSTVLRLREKTDHLRAELACAVDFPDDELDCLDRETFAQALEELDAELSLLLKGKERARLMQEGALVVLVGAVNAGKSSLMNALLGRERALVTDIPGTTRDFLEEMCSLDGLPVRLTDTAGLRSPAWEGLDRVERLGIARGKERCELADCLLLVFDASQITDQDLACDRCPDARYGEWLSAGQASPVIVVINKIDVKRSSFLPPVWAKGHTVCCVSAKTGEGLDELCSALRAVLLGADDELPTERVNCNVRQADVLARAREEVRRLLDDVKAQVAYDLCAVRLDYIAQTLGEIIGVATAEDVLNAIFDRFCIGK